jgi:hypothetical protein
MKKEILGFEFLPVDVSTNSIEIYPPFAQVVFKQFNNKGLGINHSKTGSITISFKEVDSNTKNALLKELKFILKDSRRQIIENFLIYKDTGISYL